MKKLLERAIPEAIGEIQPELTSELSLDAAKEQFSEPEQQIIRLLVLKKIQSGIVSRIVSAVNEIAMERKDKALLEQTSLVQVFNEANAQEFQEILTIAKSLGISDERFKILNDYVIEKETQF